MQPNNYITGHPDSLPSFLLAGEVHVPAPNKHFQRTTKDWIIYVITDGTMQISEGEQTYTLTAGDIMIFSPDRCHFGHLTNDHIDYYYIHFQWESLRDISMSTEAYLQAMNRHPFSPEISSRQEPLLLPKYFHPAHASFRGILQQTQYLVKDSSRNFLHQQKKNNALLFLLLLHMSQSELSHILHTETNSASLSFQILEYLQTNHSQKITSASLEEVFHHNFDYMNRRFKQYTGTTIFAFLEKYRIEQSKKLLKSRQFTIAEIAENLGFCNAFYFSRVFKKHEHITPREYQKS